MEKTSEKTLNIILIAILAFISLVQIVSYGKAICANLIDYECFNCVRMFEWLNFILGIVSSLAIIFFAIKMKKVKKAYIYLLILILLNVSAILWDFMQFFSSTLIPSN